MTTCPRCKSWTQVSGWRWPKASSIWWNPNCFGDFDVNRMVRQSCICSARLLVSSNLYQNVWCNSSAQICSVFSLLQFSVKYLTMSIICKLALKTLFLNFRSFKTVPNQSEKFRRKLNRPKTQFFLVASF